MVDLYNFLYSWQLFPEKGTYEFGKRPKSGNYKLQWKTESNSLSIAINWVTLEDQAFTSEYSVPGDGLFHTIEDNPLANRIKLSILNSLTFEVIFAQDEKESLKIRHEIMPNSLLKVIQSNLLDPEKIVTNTEIYHKQFSVLPYSASVTGAVIKHNEEGLIRHKALTSMEEQTNMQLEQIRKQIELLALQAKEIVTRKELSMLIYESKLNFAPIVGQHYYLYETKENSHILSMIAPNEWGRRPMPYKSFVSMVKLLADHTWVEIKHQSDYSSSLTATGQ